MAKSLEELKAMSPAYADIPNGEFAFRVWNAEKENTDLNKAMPMGMWADEYGLSNEDFKSMIEFSKSQGYSPTDRTINIEHIPEGSEIRAITQGLTFGFGDEMIGSMAATVEKASGNEASFEDLYTKYRDSEREKMKQFRKAAPGKALAYEVAGAIVSPGSVLKAPKVLGGLSAGKKAAVVSGTYGGIYGLGASEEETLEGMAKDTITTAVPSAIFGVALQKTIPIIGNKAKDVKKWIQKSQDKPTVENLRIAKNKAYELVNSSPVRFNNKDFNYLFDGAKKIATLHHHEQFKDKAITGALNIFKKLKADNKPYTLTQLDKIRQEIGKRYKANPEQTALGEMMDLIDDVIQQKAGQYPVMASARLANTRYKKAEKIDKAFHDMRVQLTDKTGMSESHLYKGAIRNLLKNKKDIRWFSEEEVKFLEQFIKGDFIERTIQRAAEFAPSSNKLLTMLAFAGSYFQPLFLVPTITGAISKRIADRSIRRKAEELVKTMGGIPTPPAKPIGGMPQVGSVTGATLEQ